MQQPKDILHALEIRLQQLTEYEALTAAMLPFDVEKTSIMLEKRTAMQTEIETIYEYILAHIEGLSPELQAIFQEGLCHTFIATSEKEKQIFQILERILSLKSIIFSREQMLQQEIQAEQTLLTEKMRELETEHKAQGYYKIASNLDEQQDTLLNFKYDKI